MASAAAVLTITPWARATPFTFDTGGSTTGGTDGSGSSGIVINGSGAKFVQTSSTASTPAVTVTNGTLDGTTTIGAVSVGAGTGGVVTDGNGSTGVLTMSGLTFAGSATDTVRIAGASAMTSPGQIVTEALTTSTGPITLNVAAGSLNAGSFELITYGSLPKGPSAFTRGTVAGGSSGETFALGHQRQRHCVGRDGDAGTQELAPAPQWRDAAGPRSPAAHGESFKRSFFI